MKNAGFLLALLASAVAKADVIALFTQRQGDVTLRISGSLDITALRQRASLITTGDSAGGTSVSGRGFWGGFRGGFRVGPALFSNADNDVLGNCLTPFRGGSSAVGTGFSGMPIAFADNAAQDQIRLPSSDVSGSSFTSEALFAGSFATRGFTTTSDVVMQLDGTQTPTVRFANQQASVPEPASAALALPALGGLALTRRRR